MRRTCGSFISTSTWSWCKSRRGVTTLRHREETDLPQRRKQLQPTLDELVVAVLAEQLGIELGTAKRGGEFGRGRSRRAAGNAGQASSGTRRGAEHRRGGRPESATRDCRFAPSIGSTAIRAA